MFRKIPKSQRFFYTAPTPGVNKRRSIGRPGWLPVLGRSVGWKWLLHFKTIFPSQRRLLRGLGECLISKCQVRKVAPAPAVLLSATVTEMSAVMETCNGPNMNPDAFWKQPGWDVASGPRVYGGLSVWLNLASFTDIIYILTNYFINK